MRTAPALASLAVAATAVLAGCGDQTPTAGGASPEPMPSFSVRTVAPPTQKPPAKPSRTAAQPTRPSKTPSPSGPTSGSPTQATSAPPATGTIHTYRELTIRLPVSADAVPHAPQGLTAYLDQALHADWRRLGSTRGCEKAPMITVSATRSDGWAYVMRDVDPSLESCPKAASTAGGYRAVWHDIGGTWREILAMQDVPQCTDFEKWGVPSALLGMDAQCLEGDKVVHYKHG